jgi:hypothetical protein
MVSKRGLEGKDRRGRRPPEGRVLLVVLALAAALLVAFVTLDFTRTADDAGSGGPDEEWQAEPQPIPQVPPADATSDWLRYHE